MIIFVLSLFWSLWPCVRMSVLSAPWQFIWKENSSFVHRVLPRFIFHIYSLVTLSTLTIRNLGFYYKYVVCINLLRVQHIDDISLHLIRWTIRRLPRKVIRTTRIFNEDKCEDFRVRVVGFVERDETNHLQTTVSKLCWEVSRLKKIRATSLRRNRKVIRIPYAQDIRFTELAAHIFYEGRCWTYVVGSKIFGPDQLFKVKEIKKLRYFST